MLKSPLFTVTKGTENLVYFFKQHLNNTVYRMCINYIQSQSMITQ